MSRTYRRKDQKTWWLWFGTEEEFEKAKAASKLPKPNMPKYPVLGIPYDTARALAVLQGGIWATRLEKYENELEVYRAFFHSNEYREWQYGRRFKAQKFVKGDIDFREYKRLVAVAGHSEIGYGDRYYRTAPKWYVRAFLNRPFRQKHKREIKKTLAMRDEYDVVLSPLKKSASYYW